MTASQRLRNAVEAYGNCDTTDDDAFERASAELWASIEAYAVEAVKRRRSRTVSSRAQMLGRDGRQEAR